jgi:hypothetical protein
MQKSPHQWVTRRLKRYRVVLRSRSFSSKAAQNLMTRFATRLIFLRNLPPCPHVPCSRMTISALFNIDALKDGWCSMMVVCGGVAARDSASHKHWMREWLKAGEAQKRSKTLRSIKHDTLIWWSMHVTTPSFLA